MNTRRPIPLRHAMLFAGAWLCTLTGTLPGAHAQSRVYLRGTAEPVVGRVQSLDRAGVTLKTTGAAPAGPGELRVISWDRVRVVATADGSPASIAPALSAFADGLFRARTRLERGDFDLAARVAERLYAQGETIEGPSGALLAECVLRVRLARGAHASAVSPWLRLLNVHAAARAAKPDLPVWTGGSTSLSPVIDPATGLCPALPPIFSTLRGPAAVRTLADEAWSLAAPNAPVTERVRDLAAWYKAAASHAAGVIAPLPAPASAGTVTDDGVQLVHELVLARAGSAAERERARTALQQRLATLDTQDFTDDAEGPAADTVVRARWAAGWCHAGLGLSLLREESPESRRRGVLELLHLPARFADELPQLTRIALAEAAEALRAQGQPGGAALLDDELRDLEGAIPDAPDTP